MIRCLHERVLHDGAWFLTLTYSDKDLPENGSLYPAHLQSFFKALRRRVPERLRYFACGEYGDSTKRPHYHTLLFGPHFLDRVSIDAPGPHPVWRSSVIADSWPFGLHELGTVTPESAAYVCGYVRKKLRQKDATEDPFYLDHFTGEVLRQQPFTRMSLRPAIGRRWISKYWRDVYPRDFVPVKGREYRPPRYYDRWMDEDHSESEFPCGSRCEEHQEVMKQVRMRRWEEVEFAERYELDARERHHVSRMGLFDRRDGV